MGTVHIDFRTISWGGPNEDDNTDVWQIEDGTVDPGEITLQDFGSVGTPVQGFPAFPQLPFGGKTYDFVFWNATNGIDALSGYPSTGQLLSVPNVFGVVHATAWYALPPGRNGGGGPGLRARTFDIDVNNFRKETPIQSVAPKAAWPGPNNHTASTKGADVTVTPKGNLDFPAPVPQQPPGEPSKYFQRWQKVIGATAIAPSPQTTIQCGKGDTALALAFYGHRKPAGIDVGRPSVESIYDYWAEFWAKLGAEGEGPFGPWGPGDPWGPKIAHEIERLPEGQRAMAKLMLQGLAGIANASMKRR
jgi:hypothetical protein